MSHNTRFAGLAAPDLGESPSQVLDGDFFYRNPDLIDQFLRIGAVSHRHDGHAALTNPQAPATLAGIASGGQLAGSASYSVTYTLVDTFGGETLAAPATTIETGTQTPSPSIAPSASVHYDGGIMQAGNYAYALTYTDGAGGETTLGPVTWVYVDPGFASAQVLLGGLASQLAPHGTAVTYRLWRSYEAENWHLVTESGASAYLDTGFDPPDNPALPPNENTTGDSNAIQVALPTRNAEPAMASATAINVYLSEDVAFTSPSFFEQIPIACAGASFTILSNSSTTGQPPAVSTSIPGAARINPDTDLINWTWLRPVANATQLGSAAYGCVRVALDTGQLWEVRKPAGALSAADWQPVFAGGTTISVDGLGPFADVDFISGSGVVFTITASGGSGEVRLDATGGGGLTSFIASGGTSRATVTGELDFVGSGVASAQVTDLGGGSARVTITVPAVAGPQGPSGPTGPTGGTGPTGPTGPAGTAAQALAVDDGTHRVTPVYDISFTGGATVSDVGGGSADVFITGGGGGGATAIQVEDAHGLPPVNPTSDVRFEGSGGMGVAVQGLGGGSARVLIGPAPSAAASTGGMQWQGSGVTTPTETTMVASGSANVRVAVSDLGNGSGQVLIGLPTRAMDTYTTPFLSSAASGTGGSAFVYWPLGRTAKLLHVQTDVALRIRLYSSPTKQAADTTRAVGVDPSPNSGCLLELVTSTGNLLYDLSPAVDVYSTEGIAAGVNASRGAIAGSIQNMSTQAGSFNVRFVKYVLEV